MIVFEHLSSGGGSVISRETCLPPNSIYCFAYIYNVDFCTFLFFYLSIWTIWGLGFMFLPTPTNPILERGTKVRVKLIKEPPMYLLTTKIGPERPTGYGLLINSYWRKVFTSLFFYVLINFLTNKTLQGFAKAVRCHSLSVLSQLLMSLVSQCVKNCHECSNVRLSFIDLRWAQLYVSLVVFVFHYHNIVLCWA